MSRETLAHIHLDALRHNLARVRSLAPESRVVSVVKADAYGHGVRQVLPGLEGSDLLAVATAGELHALRTAGWRGKLLHLEGFSGKDELRSVQETEADFVLHHESQLGLLESVGGITGGQAWIKLDSGMHRLGFPADDAKALSERITRLCGGVPPILMSHFACADDTANPMTSRQIECFDQAVATMSGPHSLANSAAVLNFPEAHREYVRPGVMLYGISPLPGSTGESHGLRPVMSLRTRLLSVNTVAAGETLGYGARFTCPETMQVGVAGIGYGDGYPRALPDGTPVLVNGKEARLAGRVSMDMITLDLRGHDEVKVGDEVVLWGEGLPVETVARHAGMIPYELVCGVTGRVERVVT